METTAAPVSALPTLESLINGVSDGQKPQEGAAPTESGKEDNSRLQEIEREQKHKRELFAAQKRIKDLEAKQRDFDNQASKLDPNSKNPIKDLAKQRNMTSDEVVRMALEAMDDDLTPEEKSKELKASSPEEIAKLVKEQLDKERNETEQKTRETEAIKNFKNQILTKAKESEEKYPLVVGLNASESAFELINEKYTKDIEEFGAEYAQENLMNVEEAIKKTNETLANNVKVALQSKHLRDFILKTIKDEGQQIEGSEPLEEDDQLEDEAITLNNSAHRAVTETANKPKFRSDEEELSFLINQFT